MNEKPLRYAAGGDDVHVGDLCENSVAVYIVIGMPFMTCNANFALPVAFSHVLSTRHGPSAPWAPKRTKFIVQHNGEIYSVRLLQRGHGMICQLSDMRSML